jgi:hypothetical protein
MGETKIHVVRPDQFNLGTAQTPGSERRAAIAPELGVNSAIFGIFEVEPARGREFTIMDVRRPLHSCSTAPARFIGAPMVNSSRTRNLAISSMFPLICRTWKSIRRSSGRSAGLSFAAHQHRLLSIFRTLSGDESNLLDRRAKEKVPPLEAG